MATTSLVTALDLDGLPFLIPVSPFRLVDTRRAAGRAAIVASSPLAFDSSHRLKAGAWMDIGVVPEESLQVDAAFVNLKAVSPAKSGTLSVYRPADDRPLSTTVNFPASETTACAAFVGCSVVQEWMSVRIYASATTHVVMELTGASLRLSTGPNEVSVASSGGSPYETGAARLKKALAQPR